MAAYYFLAVIGVTVAFVFSNGLMFAASFLGTCIIPCVAISAAKWGILRGDSQQRVFVPLVALGLLALTYWLSTGISVQLFGHVLGGLDLMLIGGLVGLVGIPLAWGEKFPAAH